MSSRNEIEAGGYVSNQGLRAGNTDRHKAHNLLRAARSEGRLTEAHYETRVRHLDLAQSQSDVRSVVQDLPEAIPSKSYGDLCNTYPCALHIPLQLGIMLIAVLSWLLPLELVHYGAGGFWATAWPCWGVFLGTLAPLVATVWNLIIWAEA